jgi:hypothetical protein
VVEMMGASTRAAADAEAAPSISSPPFSLVDVLLRDFFPLAEAVRGLVVVVVPLAMWVCVWEWEWEWEWWLSWELWREWGWLW